MGTAETNRRVATESMSIMPNRYANSHKPRPSPKVWPKYVHPETLAQR